MRRLIIDKKITPHDNKVLNIYFSDIRNIKTLTIEEEIELIKKIKLGDQKAKDKLVKANQRFVVSVAKQYLGSNIPLQDLINEGNRGLIRAAEKHDETKGFKFITYAVWWIRRFILLAIKESKLINIPKPLNYYKIKRYIESFFAKNGIEPNEEEISQEFSISIEEAIEIKQKIDNGLVVFSFDKPLSDEEGSDTFLDIFNNQNGESTDNQTIKNKTRDLIFEILSNLDERRKKVIVDCFGLNGQEKTIMEISEELGITYTRTRLIKETTIRKLKYLIKKHYSEEF